MHEIEKKIIGLLECGEPANLNSLGGIESIVAGWDAIVLSAMADEFLEALVSDSNSEKLPDGHGVLELFSAVILRNQNPMVIRNTSLLVCNYAAKFKKLFELLLDFSGKSGSSFIRGHYLLAAFQISLLEKSKQYRLIAFLLEDRSWDDEDFLQYLAKITGLGYVYFNNEDLFEVLMQLPDRLADRAECYFELGMANIKKALKSDRADEAKDFMRVALSFFSDVVLEDREDASCFAILVSLLLDFSDGTAKGNLKHRIAELQANLFRYHAYNRYSTAMGWASARESEMVVWNSMCDKISSLSENLGDMGWLNPSLVIEEYLLDIYSGQRSILQVNRAGGIDLLLRPEILKRLSPMKEKVGILEQWIAVNPTHIRQEVAIELIEDLERYKISHFLGNESGTVSEVLADAVPAIKKLNSEELSQLDQFIRSVQEESIVRVSKVVATKFEEILVTLNSNGFQKDKDIWKGFSGILFHSLIFLEHRMNATVKNNPSHSYLFNGNKVLESALQDDYSQCLRSSLFSCNVKTEQMDIAGGRSDVFFEFINFFIVAEIKRETVKMDLEGYRKKYIGQTLAYQGTSAKLGFLFVLDLSDNSGTIGALETNVKLVVTESVDGVKSGVVIMRMPGNRLTPSKIKENTPKTPKKATAKTTAKKKNTSAKKK